MTKRIKADIVVRDGYGIVYPSSYQKIEFDDVCPECGKEGLVVKKNNYHSDGVSYSTDNICCTNDCKFMYKDLKNVTGFNPMK